MTKKKKAKKKNKKKKNKKKIKRKQGIDTYPILSYIEGRAVEVWFISTSQTPELDSLQVSVPTAIRASPLRPEFKELYERNIWK